MNRWRPRLLPGATFDHTRTRYCIPYRSGIACYRGGLEPTGEWTGNLVGIAADESAAHRFLEGMFVELEKP